MSPVEESPEDAGNVLCTFECEASSAEWKIVDATITEELNEPYHLSLSLQTEDVDTDPTEMLGEPCAVIIERGELRGQYPAIVHRIEDAAASNRFMKVSVEASAAFWMLSQNRQTRIFQEMTVPEILDEVLGDGLSAYERKHDTDLGRTYPKCEYRVQYDESDFAFCERLMEEEGIIYRFDREGSAEVMFLADDPHSSVDVESVKGKDVHFSKDRGVRECVQSFVRYSALRPTKQTMRHFDWTFPSLPIEEDKTGEAGGDAVDGSAIGPEREVYQHDLFPPTLHDYTDNNGYQSNDANDQCQIRRELSARDKLVMHGRGTVVGFSAGGLFGLLEHNLEGDYLLTRVGHSISSDGDSANYSNHFVCIPTETPYRPARRTPKPRVRGIETATVVGPSGQEIHTDKHGRIKVQFHWDREGNKDEHSSCFMRVVQPWAGPGWGFVFIPRIGMEVTVAFVQGDPDRPIATGTVYNGENLTPYEMPDEMTKSTIRTQSSPGGGGHNELSFEDAAGKEEVYLRAQRNLREQVLAKHAMTVGDDQDIKVDNNQWITVKNLRNVHVEGNQNMTIDGGNSFSAQSNNHWVEQNEERDIVGSLKETVGVGVERTVQAGGVTDTITGDLQQTVTGGGITQTVTGGGITATATGGNISLTSTSGQVLINGVAGIQQTAPTVRVASADETDDALKKMLTYILSVGAVINKFEMTNMSMGVTGLNMSQDIAKKEDQGTKLTNFGTELTNGGTAIKNAIMSIFG